MCYFIPPARKKRFQNTIELPYCILDTVNIIVIAQVETSTIFT